MPRRWQRRGAQSTGNLSSMSFAPRLPSFARSWLLQARHGAIKEQPDSGRCARIMSSQVTKAANRNGITIIYQWKEFRDDGAKSKDIVYGTDLIEAYTQAGSMAGLVLDLADPSDIAAIPVYTLTPQVWVHTLTHKRRGRKGAR